MLLGNYFEKVDSSSTFLLWNWDLTCALEDLCILPYIQQGVWIVASLLKENRLGGSSGRIIWERVVGLKGHILFRKSVISMVCNASVWSAGIISFFFSVLNNAWWNLPLKGQFFARIVVHDVWQTSQNKNVIKTLLSTTWDIFNL